MKMTQIAMAAVAALTLMTVSVPAYAGDHKSDAQGIRVNTRSNSAKVSSQYESNGKTIIEIAESVGMMNRTLDVDDLGFLLEVSGVRSGAKGGIGKDELGFLLEVSGLKVQAMSSNHAYALSAASILGFTATDDLANILMPLAGKQPMSPEIIWDSILLDCGGF